MHEIADPLNGYLCPRIGVDISLIERVVALAGKDRRQPVAPACSHGRENTQLVIHHYIMSRWIETLNVGQHTFFVNIDENATLNGVP